VTLLRRLQRDHDLGYVLVSHDLALVADLADEILLLADGRVVERGGPAALFDSPYHPEARRAVAAVRELRRELGR
jgi:ABC-type microcin C transport system duplicated ATPase subunit YejF